MRLRRSLQALVLFFAIAQTVAPLLHAHFSGGSAGPSGVHIHLGVSIPAASHHAGAREIRDFEARIVSTPDAYLRDEEALRLLDLPAIADTASPTCTVRTSQAERFVCVPTTAAQPLSQTPAAGASRVGLIVPIAQADRRASAGRLALVVQRGPVAPCGRTGVTS